MVQAGKRKRTDDPPRQIKVQEQITAGKELPDFVSTNTMEFFRSLDLNQDFLKEAPTLGTVMRTSFEVELLSGVEHFKQYSRLYIFCNKKFNRIMQPLNINRCSQTSSVL